MYSEDLASEIPVVVLVGCLAVAVAVGSLGLGLVNVMSAGSTEPISSFGLARDARDHGMPPVRRPKTREAHILDLASIREKLTALDDQCIVLRRQATVLQQEIRSQRRAAELIDNPPSETSADGLRRLLSETERKWRERARARAAALTLNLGDAGAAAQWIECVGQALILHPQEIRFEDASVHASPAAFLAALGPGRIVLLIRPSGYAVCEAVRQLLAARGVDATLEPVDEEWRLSVERTRE
jgi:hypothetical protein